MIASTADGTGIGSLLVFSDDWGRHPSSCQHLVRSLLNRYPVLWVNTIGTRAPRLDFQTMKRVAEKLSQWKGPGGSRSSESAVHPPGSPRDSGTGQLTVVNPKMWPWFSASRDRRLNRWLLSKQLASRINALPKPVVAVTTLPITADLTDELPVFRWVYYCVDDFSQWPGLDGDTLREMDRDMIRNADLLIAASENLQGLIAAEGRTSSLLTHGVDLDFWQSGNNVVPTGDSAKPPTNEISVTRLLSDTRKQNIAFWGVIDRRMDSLTLKQLSADLPGSTITLIGPQQDPDPAILSLPNVRTLPPQPYCALPEIARHVDVLIMPYADLPVTRAMQPLKLKEYLATGKPVVVNRLPSTDAWNDCMDVAESPAEFSVFVRRRLASGVPEDQIQHRSRLQDESWENKASQFEAALSEAVSAKRSAHRQSAVLPMDS